MVLPLTNYKALQQRLAKATVKIMVGGHFKGTGFFITPEGEVLTAYHVIGICPPTITVQTFTGKQWEASLETAKSLPSQDLAVLKVGTVPLQCVPLGLLSSSLITDAVLSVGHPLGDRPDNPHLGFYQGTIFRLREDGKIETDAIRGQGQSGSLLYHYASQRVIGVAVEGYKPDRMIAGLAQQLECLFVQWPELQALTQQVASQWDKSMQSWPYRWFMAIGFILLGLIWLITNRGPLHDDKPGGNNITSGDCGFIVSGKVSGSIHCEVKTTQTGEKP